MDDDDKDDNKRLKMEARMHAPLEWDSPVYCKILDLQESLSISSPQHHFFREDPMCKAISLLKDKISVDCYLDLIRTWMKDTTSMIALSAASGRVVGAAITRINSNSEKTNTFSRNQELKGKALNKIMHLINAVISQTNAYDNFGHDEYFRVYLLCVHPTYQSKDVGFALLRACVHAARAMKLPAVGGIFTSGHNQTLAQKVGFSIVSEIRYSRWIVNDEVVFDDPGKGNYSAAFMGKVIDYNDPTQKHKDDV
ncbi:hypothetical protein KPH14_009492 [Odynerus spinipes]|uniref:N-acetyltransferase domain-containing protein n=1 Tax=Odynerus spinipes TaxID=1348599 RepID=A0AAD9RPI9_9HYME|nr:hypothetical protein KPH14_009492 [Odynerus spinipes]